MTAMAGRNYLEGVNHYDFAAEAKHLGASRLDDRAARTILSMPDIRTFSVVRPFGKGADAVGGGGRKVKGGGHITGGGF